VAAVSSYPFKTTPYAHQRTALTHLQSWRRPYFFFRMEMGTGKSKVATDNTGILYTQGELTGCVIVAPKTIVRNWVNLELPRHLPDSIERYVVTWDCARARTRTWRVEWDRLLNFNALAVLVVNVEAFSAKRFAESPVGQHVREFLKSRPCILILDESTTAKTPKATRTKNIVRVAKLAKYRRALTGSPLLPLDLYSQCEFLQPGLLGHASFQSFKSHYCDLETIGCPLPKDHPAARRQPTRVLGYQNIDELGAMLARFSYHVTKDECLDLPPKVYTRREVEMTPPQRAAYEEMRETFRAQLDQGEVTATIVLAQITRLQQILCGWVKLDDGTFADLPERRSDALFELMDEADFRLADGTRGGTIIWAPYKRDQYRIADMIRQRGGRPVVVNGDTSADERAAAVADFQAGHVTEWVGGTKVGGMGLTLTRARLMVYWSNIWSPEQRVQSEDRAHRIGLTHSVTIADLVVPDTVDVRVLDAIRNNLTLAAALAKASRDEVARWM
jgi:SNF2 family DNA or RNA helicase